MNKATVIVDIDEFKAWVKGIYLEFHIGKGICPNEEDCNGAEEELAAGNPVLLKRGNKLTGTQLVPYENGIKEEIII